MSRRLVGVLVIVVLAVASALVVWFLLRQHDVERAGAWAGIIGLAGVLLGIWGVWLGIKPNWAEPGKPAKASYRQQNRASDNATLYADQGGDQTVVNPGPHAADGGR